MMLKILIIMNALLALFFMISGGFIGPTLILWAIAVLMLFISMWINNAIVLGVTAAILLHWIVWSLWWYWGYSFAAILTVPVSIVYVILWVVIWSIRYYGKVPIDDTDLLIQRRAKCFQLWSNLKTKIELFILKYSKKSLKKKTKITAKRVEMQELWKAPISLWLLWQRMIITGLFIYIAFLGSLKNIWVVVIYYIVFFVPPLIVTIVLTLLLGRYVWIERSRVFFWFLYPSIYGISVILYNILGGWNVLHINTLFHFFAFSIFILIWVILLIRSLIKKYWEGTNIKDEEDNDCISLNNKDDIL